MVFFTVRKRKALPPSQRDSLSTQLKATQNDDTGELEELTTLEIAMLVVTIIAFVAQIINTTVSLIDHFTLKQVAQKVS